MSKEIYIRSPWVLSYNKDTEEKDPIPTWLMLFMIAPLLTIWEGVAIKHLWAWFLVPLGVLPVSVAHAVGISVLFSSVRGIRTSGKSNADMTLNGLMGMETA